VSVPAPVAMVPVLTKEINVGVKNSNDVMNLQKLLAKDKSIYPDGTVSGFFGPKTVTAIKKFQKKYGLPQVGRVGPATLKKLNEVFGTSAVVTTPSTTTGVSATTQAQVADQIQAQIKAIQDQVKALTAPATPAKPTVSAPSTSNTAVSDTTSKIQDQIKAIQAQIDALLKK